MIVEYLLLFFWMLIVSGIFGIIVSYASKNTTAKKIIRSIFYLGITVHEFSHYIMAKITNLKIIKAQILPESTGSGLEGRIHPDDPNFFQSIVVAFAPLIVGTYLITFLLQYLVSPFVNYTIGVVIIYLAVSILAAISPSRQDLRVITISWNKHKKYAIKQGIFVLVAVPLASFIIIIFEITLFDAFLNLFTFTLIFYNVIKYLSIGMISAFGSLQDNRLRIKLTKYKVREKHKHKYKDDNIRYSPRTQW